jgi:hypothetical protein
MAPNIFHLTTTVAPPAAQAAAGQGGNVVDLKLSD